jgi:hypothetical protein
MSKWYFISVLRIILMILFLTLVYSFLENPLKIFPFIDASNKLFLLILFVIVSKHNLNNNAVWCLSKGESSEYRIANFDCVEISKELVLEVCPKS